MRKQRKEIEAVKKPTVRSSVQTTRGGGVASDLLRFVAYLRFKHFFRAPVQHLAEAILIVISSQNNDKRKSLAATT